MWQMEQTYLPVLERLSARSSDPYRDETLFRDFQTIIGSINIVTETNPRAKGVQGRESHKGWKRSCEVLRKTGRYHLDEATWRIVDFSYCRRFSRHALKK